MEKKIRIRGILPYVAMLFMVLFMVSCYEEEEKALVGTWTRTETSSDGLTFNRGYRFDRGDEENTFIEELMPVSYRGIGYAVEGTWEIDLTGGLVLHYYLNTLKPLAAFNSPDVSVYLAQLKMQISMRNAEFNNGATMPFEIKGKTLILTTEEGKEKFTRTQVNKRTQANEVEEAADESEPHPSRVYEGEEIDWSGTEGDPPIEEDDDDDW